MSGKTASKRTNGGAFSAISKGLDSMKAGGIAEDRLIIILIASVFFLAYILPVIMYPMPTGTDVYTHMFYTENMAGTDSLDGFYSTCYQEGFIGCDYPFGLWLFGSVTSKITGVGIFELSYILPLVVLAGTVLLFYAYSGVFLKTKRLALLSVLFLVTMPNISISALGYAPSIFSIPILLSILYLTLKEDMQLSKRIALMAIFILCLVITHTGTYIFLLSFVMIYLLFSAILWGKLEKHMFILLISMLVIYAIGAWLFPYVQSQYTDKARLFITIGDFFSGGLGLGFMSQLSELFYQRVFVERSIVDAVFWSAFFYAIIELIVFVRSKVPKIDFKKKVLNPKRPAKIGSKSMAVTIPIIGEIRNISHSVIATPVWIGPVHSLLSVIGIFRLKRKGITVLLSVIVVALIPGALHTGATGALREIFYLMIIIPIVSALGFEYLENKIRGRFSKRKKRAILTAFLLVVLVPIVMLPTIGNIYYRLEITGTDYERNGMTWLAGIGSPDEGVSGYGYRHMISTYSGKNVPGSTTVTSGSETRVFSDHLKRIYFTEGSESYVDNLYTNFDVKYLISSEKVANNLEGEPGELKISSNKNLDRIYATRNDFSIYNYVPPEYPIARQKEVGGAMITYDENEPVIEDKGLDYVIETDYYRAIVSKSEPVISYLGTGDVDYLGDGSIEDLASLYWFGGPNDGMGEYVFLSELNNSRSSAGDNQIIYKSVIKVGDDQEWATAITKYTFHERAIKKEVIIANDRADLDENAQLRVIFSSRQFSPMVYFSYYDGFMQEDKRIYPSEDSVKLGDVFDSIFMNDGEKGIYIEYGRTSHYPDEIIYKGSTLYNYSSINLYSRMFLGPSDSMHVTQFITVGEEETAKSNVREYTASELLLYPEARAPVVLAGYTDSLRSMGSDELSRVTYSNNMLNTGGSVYTLGLPMTNYEFSLYRMNDVLQYNRDVMAFEGFYDVHSRLFDSSTTQQSKITEMKSVYADYSSSGAVINMRGLVPSGLYYNLDTIRILDEEDVGFIVGTTVRPPYMGFYESGLRNPKFGYYMGQETGVVILPVSFPTSSSLRENVDTEETLGSWKAAIDACVDNDEMCLFLWEPDRIGMLQYSDIAGEVVDYAESRGAAFSKPADIEQHFRLLQNVSAEIANDVDEVTIRVHNGNDKDVNGIGFRVFLPRIDGDCPYKTNGKEARTEAHGGECRIYVSKDVAAGETVMIYVEPDITRKTFVTGFVRQIEGETVLYVSDSAGVPVGGASVSVVGKLFKTDGNGTAELDIKRGLYTASIEKPGFETKNIQVDVKGRVFSLWEIPPETYAFYVVVLGLLIVVFVYREMLHYHAVDKSKRGVSGFRRMTSGIKGFFRKLRKK